MKILNSFFIYLAMWKKKEKVLRYIKYDFSLYYTRRCYKKSETPFTQHTCLMEYNYTSDLRLKGKATVLRKKKNSKFGWIKLLPESWIETSSFPFFVWSSTERKHRKILRMVLHFLRSSLNINIFFWICKKTLCRC